MFSNLAPLKSGSLLSLGIGISLILGGCRLGGDNLNPTLTKDYQESLAVGQSALKTLAYETNPAIYTVGTPITPNLASKTEASDWSFAIEPSLPAGLNFDSSSGTISGTPQETRTTTVYRVTGRNIAGSTAVDVTLTVNAISPSIHLPGTSFDYTTGDTVSITPSLGASATQVSITPALSNGLTLNNSTGEISGISTGTLTSTTYTLTASNSTGQTEQVSLNLAIHAAPSISVTGSPFTFTQGTGISSISPSLGPSVTSVSISPALTATGLNFNTTSGVISGTPSASLTPTTFTLTASNAAEATATASISIRINAVAPTISYSSSTYHFSTGETISLTPSLGPSVTNVSISPALSNGLGLNNTSGAISGSASGTLAATNYTITASNSTGQSVTVNINLAIHALPTVSYSGSSYNLTRGSYFSTSPTVGSSVTSLTITPSLSGTNLTFSASGVISGTPNITMASTTYTVTAYNQAGASVTAPLDLTINPPVGTVTIADTSSSQLVYDNSGTVSVTLDIDEAQLSAVTVPYRVHGEALPGTHHDLAASGTFSIPAGQTSHTITINLVNDGITNPERRLILSLDTPTTVNAKLGIHYQAIIHILDSSQTLPTVSSLPISNGNNDHGCAILSNGALRCWGYDGYRQLGGGGSTSQPWASPISSNVIQAAVGTNHTCAVLTGGVAQCWGLNFNGQLGTGDTSSQTSPVNTTATGIAQIATAETHTCAVTTGGAVQCWGSNSQGELGDGSGLQKTSPVTAVSSNASSVATGGTHSCAILSTGELKCWGLNSYGQIGIGNTINQPTPVSTIASGVTKVSLGAFHSCALLSGGELKCWGRNDYGQIGIGNTTTQSTPASVIANNVVDVASGYYHTCAILTSGSVKCWGRNYGNALGNRARTSANQTSPPSTNTIESGAVKLMAMKSGTCALLSNGHTQCWGINDKQQMGVANGNDQFGPKTLIATGGSKISIASSRSCIITTGGALQCTGNHTAYGALGIAPSTNLIEKTQTPLTIIPSGVSQVAASTDFICAVLTSGALQCWGGNSYGRLGTGDVNSKTTPTTIIASGITKVATGLNHACALSSSGSLQCWGYNNYGQLGDGTTVARYSPTTIFASGVLDVATDREHTCAVLTGGEVRCWGNNNSGQLGNGNSVNQTSPVSIIASGAAKISVSENTSCATMSDGETKCWGYNGYFNFGNGSSTNSFTPITGVASGVAKLAVGGTSTCMLLTTGELQCSGAAYYGANGTNTANSSPVTIIASGVSDIEADASNSVCAVLTTGEIKCWGSNSNGKLGTGLTQGEVYFYRPDFLFNLTNY